MGKKSRTKGADGEREFAAAVYEELGVRLVRRLRQYQSGGCDLELHPDESGPVAAQIARYAFEVKRHSRATPHLLKGWWAQTTTQAEAAGKVPVLAYREDRQDWRVLLPLAELRDGLTQAEGLDWTATLSLPGFCALVREAA